MNMKSKGKRHSIYLCHMWGRKRDRQNTLRSLNYFQGKIALYQYWNKRAVMADRNWVVLHGFCVAHSNLSVNYRPLFCANVHVGQTSDHAERRKKASEVLIIWLAFDEPFISDRLVDENWFTHPTKSMHNEPSSDCCRGRRWCRWWRQRWQLTKLIGDISDFNRSFGKAVG